MLNKRIKNNDVVPRTWVGQIIQPGDYYLIQAFEDIRWAHDSQLITDIGAGLAIVNDGVNDLLDVNIAVNYLKGSVPPFVKKEDTFSATGTGVAVDATLAPFRHFTLSVRTTGTVTLWKVILEGSIDTVYTTIAEHTNLDGSGVAVFPGVNVTPCLHFRVRCESITALPGGSVTATVVGVQ